ncbi:MAG TPA: sulfite exporter TauE/SafE family protein [Candidatus Bathyarchaeota archaeon]|nr:sulfite exporter TauE/SafE family protein [Candidatus Bathyarchaeota archaeon]
MEEILFWLAAFFAEVIGTMAGFGSSTIFLPIALFFLDFRTALTLVAVFHMSGNIGRITFFRHGFNKRLLLIFGLPSVILTLLGALLVTYVPSDILKLVLGVFLIVFSVASLYKPEISFSPSKKNSFIGGSLSGFFAGLIGTGGALRGAFLTSFNLEKSVYVATAAAISLAVDVTRIPVYFGSGFLQPQFYYYIPILFLLAISGSFTGKKIVNRISQPTFRKVVLVAITLVSLKFVYDGITFLI